jgi:hypothetical protein
MRTDESRTSRRPPLLDDAVDDDDEDDEGMKAAHSTANAGTIFWFGDDDDMGSALENAMRFAAEVSTTVRLLDP